MNPWMDLFGISLGSGKSGMLIKDLPDEHIEVACALFLQVFSVEVSPVMWRWKYQGTAQLGAINLVAYDADGALAGHAGAIVLPGVDQGQSRAMVQICDVMVAAHHRGGKGDKAVYPALMRAMRAAITARFAGAYAYGFPGKRPFLLGERLGFYRRAYEIGEQTIAPLSVSTPRWSLTRIDVLAQDTLPLHSARLQKLWQYTAKNTPSPTVVRDAAYVIWRYAQHPARRYALLMLRGVWRDVAWWIVAHEGETLRVVDALGHKARSASALKLLAAWASRQGYVRLLCWRLAMSLPETSTGIVAMQFALNDIEAIRDPCFMPGDLDIF